MAVLWEAYRADRSGRRSTPAVRPHAPRDRYRGILADNPPAVPLHDNPPAVLLHDGDGLRLAILRDFYGPGELQSSCMFIPASERPAVWRAFTNGPENR